jgi:hypothetical protein
MKTQEMNRSVALKLSWALIKSADWKEGEQETIKIIPLWALRFVYNRIKNNPDLYMNAFSQCGWKFEEVLK